MLNGKQMENEWNRNGKIPFIFAKGDAVMVQGYFDNY